MSFTTRNTALLAAVLLSATTMAGDIQQVAAKKAGCGSVSCGEVVCSVGCSTCGQEGCNVKSKKVRCKNSNGQACQSCQSCNNCNQCNSCDACDSKAGKCSMRNRMDAFALDWTSKCGPIGRRAAKGRPLAQKLHWHCTTKAFPDSGWAPPATRPVLRSGGTYTAYNNFGMGGYAPAAPMVYQPTDTTQLGYSYANVPQWRPNPNMIPAVPIPSNFHNRFCPAQACGTSGCQAGQCNMRSMSHEVYYEPINSSCPSCNLSSIQQPVRQHVTAPAPTRTAAAVAAKPAALKPAVTKVRAITPPPIQMEQTSVRPKAQVKQVSQQQTVRPSNQMAQQRVRPSNNYRRPQQQKQSSGWFGLPSLSEMQF